MKIDFSKHQIALAKKNKNTKNVKIDFVCDELKNINNFLQEGDFLLTQFLLQFLTDQALHLVLENIIKNYNGYFFIQEGISTLQNRIILQDFDMKVGHAYNTQYRTLPDFFNIFSQYFEVLEYNFILQAIKTERMDSKYVYFVLKTK